MIELDNVAYSYGGGELLSELSLQLAPGSFHFLTGPSGTGKTTLLKLCYGALRPTAGQARLFGTDVREMDRDAVALSRRRIGVVHQDCQFLDHLTLAENVALPLTVAGEPISAQDQNLRELLGWVGLSSRANALPPELSGGERQRAALARAVISSPEVVLADEPTGNLDEATSEKVLAQFLDLVRGQGSAALVATHNERLAAKMDRVVRLHEGLLE